ncbi:MAG: hypothetical protein ACR2IF_05800 [Terriglobales bacterium]
MGRLRSPKFIFLAALAIRAAVVTYFYRTTSFTLATIWNVAYEMAHVGANVAAGAGFSSPFQEPTGPTAILPPGYPALLAGIFRMFGTMTATSAAVAVGLNLLFSALTCVVIFFLAKRTLGENAAVIAAWIWAVYPPVILSAGFHVWDGTLTTLLAACVFLLATKMTSPPRPVNAGRGEGGATARDWAVFAVVWGGGALVNPSVLAIGGAVWLWAVWKERAVRNGMIAATIAVVMLAPWGIRNYRIFHRVWPVRSNFGEELWIGNHPGADGYFRVLLYPLGNGAELMQYQRRGEAGYMEWKQREAMAFIRAHPGEFLRLTVHRMSCIWGGVRDAGYDPIFLPTTLLGLTGLLLLARRDRGLMWFFLLPLLIYPIPYYVTHPDLRFRFPMEPLLTCLSGYAVVVIAECVRERARAKALVHAAPNSRS